jgi:hypothetical protein
MILHGNLLPHPTTVAATQSIVLDTRSIDACTRSIVACTQPVIVVTHPEFTRFSDLVQLGWIHKHSANYSRQLHFPVTQMSHATHSL